MNLFEFEGDTFLRGEYGGIESEEPIPISVVDDVVTIDDISESTFPNSAFNAQRFSEVLINLDVFMSDGTTYENALSLPWLNMHENLRFNVARDAMNVSDVGIATILDNFWGDVPLVVTTLCENPPLTTSVRSLFRFVYWKTNLAPSHWDFDVDEISESSTGLQFEPHLTSDVITIQISSNAEIGSLITWSFTLW